MTAFAALLQPSATRSLQLVDPSPDQERKARELTRTLLETMGLVAKARSRGVNAESAVLSALQSLSRSDQDMRTGQTLAGLLTRAAQGPASTSDPAWAGALVNDVAIAYADMLASEGAVVPLLPMRRVPLVRGLAKVPVRRAGGTVNLAAAWRREGAPIRVGALTVGAQVLTPKSMGVIGTVSKEALRAAGPNELEAIIRQAILADSSKVLDTTFFDDEAATDERPAGIGAGVTGDDTAASSGDDAAAITSDARARVDRLIDNGFGNPATTRWVVNTKNQAALLALVPEMQQRGTLLGYQVVAGTSVPEDVVYLVDFAAVAFAADSPSLEVNDEALVHEEGDPAEVAEDVMTGVPIRSLFQTECSAVKAVWDVTWAVLAPGAVQVISGVAW